MPHMWQNSAPHTMLGDYSMTESLKGFRGEDKLLPNKGPNREEPRNKPWRLETFAKHPGPATGMPKFQG